MGVVIITSSLSIVNVAFVFVVIIVVFKVCKKKGLATKKKNIDSKNLLFL